jgi:cell division protein FtsL
MNARIQKTRKKIRLDALAVLCFSLVLMTYFFTSIVLRSVNVSMSVQVQNHTQAIAQIESQNKTLSKEIQTLSDYERVAAIAKEAGLTLNNSNVVEFSSSGE